MIDIRYHIYSIAAVFLALSVGIVIGTSFARSQPPSLAAQRTIQRYNEDMRVLQTEIHQYKDTATQKETSEKKCQEFCQAILPIAVKNRLQWRNVAIIQTGDYDEATGAIKRTLELAGAHVNCVADINRKFDFDSEKGAAEALNSIGVAQNQNSTAARTLFSVVSDAIYFPRSQDLTTKLENAGIAKLTVYAYFKPSKLVVLVGGARSDSGNSAGFLDTGLTTHLQKFGATVVGCETTTAGSSYISAWQKTGIASVDNIDWPIGQIALISALSGENATFGIKETADRLVPQTLEGK